MRALAPWSCAARAWSPTRDAQCGPRRHMVTESGEDDRTRVFGAGDEIRVVGRARVAERLVEELPRGDEVIAVARDPAEPLQTVGDHRCVGTGTAERQRFP